MDDAELKSWNDERVRLFAGARIPPHALAAILHDARRLDYETAMRALPIYRAAKPYRGFYAVDWARHYEQSRIPTATGRTDRALMGAPAARSDDEEREQADADKAREIRDYNALDAKVRQEAADKLGYLGWSPSADSRAWRMIVLMWHRGEDVTKFFHPSRLCGNLPEAKRTTVSRDELIGELRAIITGARWRLEEMGVQP